MTKRKTCKPLIYALIFVLMGSFTAIYSIVALAAGFTLSPPSSVQIEDITISVVDIIGGQSVVDGELQGGVIGGTTEPRQVAAGDNVTLHIVAYGDPNPVFMGGELKEIYEIWLEDTSGNKLTGGFYTTGFFYYDGEFDGNPVIMPSFRMPSYSMTVKIAFAVIGSGDDEPTGDNAAGGDTTGSDGDPANTAPNNSGGASGGGIGSGQASSGAVNINTAVIIGSVVVALTGIGVGVAIATRRPRR
ncbi:MAG: hypothetical protein FWD44_08240 [Oscillospiraceae bacterium]|nr:hypothetical protein [Oscillospiraceae bacterium]